MKKLFATVRAWSTMICAMVFCALMTRFVKNDPWLDADLRKVSEFRQNYTRKERWSAAKATVQAEVEDYLKKH